MNIKNERYTLSKELNGKSKTVKYISKFTTCYGRHFKPICMCQGGGGVRPVLYHMPK